jgi:hypothetical protein
LSAALTRVHAVWPAPQSGPATLTGRGAKGRLLGDPRHILPLMQRCFTLAAKKPYRILTGPELDIPRIGRSACAGLPLIAGAA